MTVLNLMAIKSIFYGKDQQRSPYFYLNISLDHMRQETIVKQRGITDVV